MIFLFTHLPNGPPLVLLSLSYGGICGQRLPLAQVPVFSRAFLICSISRKEALPIQAETHALSKDVSEGYLIPHTPKAFGYMPFWVFPPESGAGSKRME